MYRKTCTGLKGLAVDKNPYVTLSNCYNKLYRLLQKFPDESCYKQYTVEIVSKRSQILQDFKSNLCEVERQINCGQLEEVIIQAKNEYKLAQRLLQDKVWEPLAQEPPEDQWKWPPVQGS